MPLIKTKGKLNDKDLKISMWCQGNNEDSLAYVFQIQARSVKLLHTIAKLIMGVQAGTGFDTNKKENILLVKKEFSSRDELNKFSNDFEYRIEKVK